MIGSLAVLIGGGTAMRLGASSGTLASVESLMMMFCAVFGSLTAGGLITDHIKNKSLETRSLERNNKLLQLAKKHNDITDLLEEEYRMEKKSAGLFGSFQEEELRERYELLYYRNKDAFNQEYKQLTAQQNAESPITQKFKKFWKILFVVGLITHIAASCYTLGTADRLEASPQPDQLRGWTAEAIPMPHLKDGNRYVSNPDEVVSSHTVQLLDQQLKRMDDSLQIESAMIIVNHVANADVFRIAQDIFDQYHVGKNDRGLVIVLAYLDHKVRIHTGRALEADLTDIECSRLQQTYAIPFMKAEQPDSGMIHLTNAIYNTLEKKDLPHVEVKKIESEADAVFGYFQIYIVLLGVWALLLAYLYHRYNGVSGKQYLRKNPFAKAAPVIFVGGGGFGGGQGGGFGGGGFGGGGGFSGGSSGGGGATSSW